MPVSDKEFLLRDGTTALTATGSGTGKRVGPGPIHGMKAFYHYTSVTGTSPTLTLKIQESDTLGSGYTDVASFPDLSGTDANPSYVEIHFHWTKRYLRYDATVGGTPSYNNLKVGLTPGEIATT